MLKQPRLEQRQYEDFSIFELLLARKAMKLFLPKKRSSCAVCTPRPLFHGLHARAHSQLGTDETWVLHLFTAVRGIRAPPGTSVKATRSTCHCWQRVCSEPLHFICKYMKWKGKKIPHFKSTPRENFKQSSRKSVIRFAGLMARRKKAFQHAATGLKVPFDAICRFR